MKKFFCLPLLALLFASCSTDNDIELLQEEAVVVTTVNTKVQKMAETAATINCINSLAGASLVDVSGGFGNPRVVFIADVPNTRTTAIGARYNVTLEMEVLNDCEDLTSGSGTIIKFSLVNVTIPSISDPRITLLPTQLPANCYRWRYVVEGVKNTTSGQFECLNITPWYEEPLF